MEQPQSETHDASIRTRLSLEYTLKSWIRTTTGRALEELDDEVCVSA